MLTGQNGILTNATNANSSSVYYGAEEQVKLAYMSVRTQIMTEKVANSSYNAQSTSNPDNVTVLTDIVKKDLNTTKTVAQVTEGTGEGFGVTASGSEINIIYKNAKIYEGTIESNKPKHNGYVTYKITLDTQDAELDMDEVSVIGNNSSNPNSEPETPIEEGNNNPNSEPEPETPTGITGIDFGVGKSATTIDVGDDLKIGTEYFRVLKTDKSTQIIAMPHYNITLNTSNPEQTLTVEPPTDGGAANQTKFVAKKSNKYWTKGQDDIDWKNDKCLLKPYIQAYSDKLDAATGSTGKVWARGTRYSDVNTNSIILPQGSSLSKNQVRFPNGGGFWLCANPDYDTLYCIMFCRKWRRDRFISIL